MKKMENICLDGMWERLENEIKKQDITKVELARRCRFNKRVLIKHNSIYLPYLARICAELHISADFLLFGK